MSNPRAKIIGTGSYLPEKVLTNFDLEKMVDTTDEWIRTRTGIQERHIAAPDQAASDLSKIALERALVSAGISAEDLDFIIVATVCPDTTFPSTACILQNKIGARTIPAVDITAACSGFMYGLTMAKAFIESGAYKTIAIIGVELLTRYTDWKDRDTCVLFGDGAGVVILQANNDENDTSCIVSTHLAADGSLNHLIIKEAEGSRNPASHETVDAGMHYIKMEGREVFRHAVRSMLSVAEEALKSANLQEADVDWIITHQANIRIIESLAERLSIPRDRVFVNIEKCGNTSAASIPIALDEMNRKGMLEKGSVILTAAFGGGLTSGSVIIRW